jgi:hypothetical protein
MSLLEFAVVGLSTIRETSTFSGMPIVERRLEPKCGVGVVDVGTGRLIGHLEFMTGVEEIFDVQVVPGDRCPAFSGPYASQDSATPIWTVPQPLHRCQEPFALHRCQEPFVRSTLRAIPAKGS